MNTYKQPECEKPGHALFRTGRNRLRRFIKDLQASTSHQSCTGRLEHKIKKNRKYSYGQELRLKLAVERSRKSRFLPNFKRLLWDYWTVGQRHTK